jgi:hypothetical protein
MMSIRESWNKSIMTLKSKTEVLTSTLEFNEVHEFNKNVDIKTLKFISFFAWTANSLKKCADQIARWTEVMNAKVKVTNIKSASACIHFLMHWYNLIKVLMMSLQQLIASSTTELQSYSITYFEDVFNIYLYHFKNFFPSLFHWCEACVHHQDRSIQTNDE